MIRIVAAIAADHRVRFIGIGAVNTAIGYAVFVAAELLLFGRLTNGYLLSLLVSYVVGISVAFVLYRTFVFRDVGPWWRSIWRFISVYLASITVNAILLPLLVVTFGLEPVLAQAICIVVTTVMSYVGHRWFSFRGGPAIDRRPSRGSDDIARGPDESDR